MVIDPRLYEKLSGRKGDPNDRLGQALATDSLRTQARSGQKDRSMAELMLEGHANALLVKWTIGIIVSIVLLIALAWGLLF